MDDCDLSGNLTLNVDGELQTVDSADTALTALGRATGDEHGAEKALVSDVTICLDTTTYSSRRMGMERTY